MELTGIILAGGKSSRMGTDKGLMLYSGKQMVQYSIELLNLFTAQILISSNNHEYNQFGFPVISDIYKECGPIGGLHAALSASTTEWNIIVTCDAPNIRPELYNFMLVRISNQDAIIPIHAKGIEPLFGIYNKKMSSFFEQKINENDFKLQKILKERNIDYFETSELINQYPRLYSNINSPEDLSI